MSHDTASESVDRRRSFLKLAGFGMFAACSRGIEYKAIPLLNPIEERVPAPSNVLLFAVLRVPRRPAASACARATAAR